MCLNFSEATKAEKLLLAASGYLFYYNRFFYYNQIVFLRPAVDFQNPVPQ
jgi:hypothetical protein